MAGASCIISYAGCELWKRLQVHYVELTVMLLSGACSVSTHLCRNSVGDLPSQTWYAPDGSSQRRPCSCTLSRPDRRPLRRRGFAERRAPQDPRRGVCKRARNSCESADSSLQSNIGLRDCSRRRCRFVRFRRQVDLASCRGQQCRTRPIGLPSSPGLFDPGFGAICYYREWSL